MKTGERIADRFVITGPAIGEGASGVVYPADEVETGRKVAIKQLHAHFADDAAAVARFRAEAAAAGRGKHPNVLEVLGFWKHGERYILVSAYCDGQALERLPILSIDQALTLAHQVAQALEQAHASNRLHGDMRPGNVLWGTDGASVFDFGLAHLWRQSRDAADRQYRPGQTAPEVLQGAPLSRRADLYGLGVVLFRALYGRMPFDGETPFAIVGAQRRGPPDVGLQPTGVAALLTDLLQPDPVQRPGDIGKVVSALERLRKTPNRASFLGANWLAPARFQRAWIVHGTDPNTGAPAVFAQGMTSGAASGLVKRLNAEGWRAERTQEALSWLDLVWAMIIGVLLSVPFNIPGGLVGVGLGLRWRSSRVEPRIRHALPSLSVPMPPIVQPAGNEVAVFVGLMMMVMIPLLIWWPMLALPPALVVVGLVASSWRGREDDHASLLRSRVTLAIAETERLIALRKIDLDAQLALQGECQEVENSWRGGGLNADEALLRIEALSVRVRTLPGST